MFASRLLRRHAGSNLIIDARNGFEDDKADIEWGFGALLPDMAESDCKTCVFILDVLPPIAAEIDLWTAEFKKYFRVCKVLSYSDAVRALSEQPTVQCLAADADTREKEIRMEEKDLRALMASGRMYDDAHPVLCERRNVANALLAQYAATAGRPVSERIPILRRLLKSVGENVHFEPRFGVEFGWNISVGNNFYGNADLMILDGGEVTIGDNVFIGPKCGIYTTNHAFDVSERRMGGVYARPVRIESDVWFCGGVSVTPGVTIGAGSIIGAGSVVTKDVPSGVVAAGNPCRVLRAITEADKTGYVRG